MTARMGRPPHQSSRRFEPCSNTISYVVTDPETRHCAVIDSVLDYDPAAGEISYQHADEVMTI